MALLQMQSFVDAAGEALGLIDDPLLTPIGIKGGYCKKKHEVKL